MFPNAPAKPLIILPAIAGEQAAALSGGSEAICLEAKLIFSLDRKWKVEQAALTLPRCHFLGVGETADGKRKCLPGHHRSRFDLQGGRKGREVTGRNVSNERKMLFSLYSDSISLFVVPSFKSDWLVAIITS